MLTNADSKLSKMKAPRCLQRANKTQTAKQEQEQESTRAAEVAALSPQEVCS